MSILCMESVLDYYEYMDRTPSAWHIALDNRCSRERFTIDYPIVKAHFTEPKRLNLGVLDGYVDGVSMKICDREHTICDCMRNRNKMDAEVFNEAIQSYLKDTERILYNDRFIITRIIVNN